MFENVNLDFLSKEETLIPTSDFIVEKTQLWYLLCKKFKDDHICMTKLLPEAIIMCNYIEKYVLRFNLVLFEIETVLVNHVIRILCSL